MVSRMRTAVLVLALATGLVGAGCGANTSMSPIGPTAAGDAPVTTQVSAGGASTTALLGGGFSTLAKGGSKRPENSKRVEINGRISSIDLAARTFVVDGRSVSVPLTTTIRHGARFLAFATLAVRDHVQVKGTPGEEDLFVASEVKVEPNRKPAAATDEEGEEGEEGDDDEDGEDDEDTEEEDEDASET